MEEAGRKADDLAWHTTQLEILQDDGKKFGQEFSWDAPFKKADNFCRRWFKKRTLLRRSLYEERLEWRKLRRRLMIWHTTQPEILQDDGAKIVRKSHETLSLRGWGLEWRKLVRRLVIWHTTQLEILQDDGAKTGQNFL
jgi:hypothetical protein